MIVEIEIGGRMRVVTVEPIGRVDHTGGRFRLAIRDAADQAPGRGRSQVVDAQRLDRGWSIVQEETRRVVEAIVTERPRGALLIQLPGAVVEATVDGRRFRRETLDEGAAGEQRIVAPMPGRVVRVLVRPGDEVSARQGLVVVEAMKMENELAAGRPGRVVDVAVTEGQPVEAGRLLVRLE